MNPPSLTSCLAMAFAAISIAGESEPIAAKAAAGNLTFWTTENTQAVRTPPTMSPDAPINTRVPSALIETA